MVVSGGDGAGRAEGVRAELTERETSDVANASARTAARVAVMVEDS